MEIFWYGLVLFGVIAVAFIVYASVMISLRPLSHPGSTNPAEQNCSVSYNLNPYPASTFKYKKGVENIETPEKECVVCLSDFEDEEYVRQLSQCRHSFHAPCIDMWLYTHSDCPLCRTPIHRLSSDDGASTRGTSMEGLLDIRPSS